MHMLLLARDNPNMMCGIIRPPPSIGKQLGAISTPATGGRECDLLSNHLLRCKDYRHSSLHLQRSSRSIIEGGSMGLVEGKKALIIGVANDHSIAWGIARAL